MAPSVLGVDVKMGAGRRSAVNRQLLFALGAAGIVATCAAAALILFAQDFMPYGPGEKVVQVVTDGIWIGTGLVAWWHRPDNRVGPLMVALGFVELAHNLFWDAPVPFTLAELVSFWSLPISVFLFVSFPGGRLGTRSSAGSWRRPASRSSCCPSRRN